MKKSAGRALAELCTHVTVPAGQRLFDGGSTASQFWIIDAGQVRLDASVPGRGRVIIEMLGRNDVIGLSWMLPPYQWRFGAIATQSMQAFAFDASAVRAVVVHRLQAARARLLEAHAHSGMSRSSCGAARGGRD